MPTNLYYSPTVLQECAVVDSSDLDFESEKTEVAISLAIVWKEYWKVLAPVQEFFFCKQRYQPK